MTIIDLRCDVCGSFLAGPEAGVRFVYHPGVPDLRDDTGAACSTCWTSLTRGLDLTPGGHCAACGEAAPRRHSLHVRQFSEPGSWRLCTAHAIEFLNSLRTVNPKLDAATFKFPGMPERT